jgi:23S rRNA pseudouridine2605 synthase
MAKERVQKILARAGLASRRKSEELISEGEVTINGKVAKLGDQAEWGVDAIKVKGKLLHSTEALVYLSFFKPKGVISMFGDPDGRPSLNEYLGKVKSRLFPVGRLDFNSEGLLLLTNDGDFSEKIQKRDDIIRVYHVKIKGHPDSEMIKRLERGAKVGNKMVRPESITLTQEYAKKAQVEVVLQGGGAIDLKSYFEMKGFLVERITRIAFGHLRLSGMKPGEFRTLQDSQAKALLDQPELGMRRQQFEEIKGKKKLPEVRDPVKAPRVVVNTPGPRSGFKGGRSDRGAHKIIAPRVDRSARVERPARDERSGPRSNDRPPRRFDEDRSSDRAPITRATSDRKFEKKLYIKTEGKSFDRDSDRRPGSFEKRPPSRGPRRSDQRDFGSSGAPRERIVVRKKSR